jgi:hypothetical protein
MVKLYEAAREQAARPRETIVLVRVTAPHFVAGVVIDAETAAVIAAAPILGYTLGWSARRLRKWVDFKRWEAERVDEPETPEADA